jgi:hypothetical protein
MRECRRPLISAVGLGALRGALARSRLRAGYLADAMDGGASMVRGGVDLVLGAGEPSCSYRDQGEHRRQPQSDRRPGQAGIA